MVLRYCLGMIMSVSTLIIFSGAATPSSVVNLSMSFARSQWNSSLMTELVFCQVRSQPRLRRASRRRRSARRRLDRGHVVIGKTEMVADLVHQDVSDDRAQRLVVLGPVIEDRPAVEPHHVGHLSGRAVRAKRQADALEQAEQIELGLRAQLVQHLLGREILHPDDEVLAQRAEFLRQPAKRRLGERFELLERRRLDRAPGERIGKYRIGHGFSFKRAATGGQGIAIMPGISAGGAWTLTAARRWASVGQVNGRAQR